MEDSLIQFVEFHYGLEAAKSIKPIVGGGSSRKYYRFSSGDENFVLTQSSNREENRSFIYMAEHFAQFTSLVPKVFQVSEDETLYIQSDLGDSPMIDFVLKDKENSKKLYEKVIRNLAKIQIEADRNFDYSKCFSYPKFNQILVLRDLFSCKNYFLNLLQIPFNHAKLLKDFEQFSKDFETLDFQYFVFRDFQTRNIMIHQNEPYFIDFQGGLKGPILYDLVSLIWQAKTNLNSEWKEEFYKLYFHEVQQNLNFSIDFVKFRKAYEVCVVERLFQVLGTYGFRGIYEGKKHFIESIEFALGNLKEIQNYPILTSYPTLKSIIEELIKPQTFNQIKKIIHERQIAH